MQRPKFKQLSFYIALSSIFLIGLISCTQTIRQSSDLSQAGIKYSDAMSKLLDVTTDTVIDSDNNDLLYQQKLTSNENKEEEREKLKEFLDQHNKEVKKLIETIGLFQNYTRLLKDYFTNLQAFASSNAPETATIVICELNWKINEANKAITKKEKVLLSDGEKDAIGKLAGVVAKGIQSAMLQHALKRDASIIGEQLLLQEKLLAKLSDMLDSRYKDYVTIMEKERVRKPYINKTITNEEDWKEVRSQFLKSVFLDQSLQNAKSAIKELRLIWENILNEKQDIGSIQSTLSDINEFLNDVNKLKESIQARKESK